MIYGGPGDYGHVKLMLEPDIKTDGISVHWEMPSPENSKEDCYFIPPEYENAVREGINLTIDNFVKQEMRFASAKVRIVGGSYHLVDSRHRSFLHAGAAAFQSAIALADLALASNTHSK